MCALPKASLLESWTTFSLLEYHNELDLNRNAKKNSFRKSARPRPPPAVGAARRLFESSPCG